MTKQVQQIKCPSCDTPINVNDILYQQLEQQVQKEYGSKLASLEKEKAGITEAIVEGVSKQLAIKKTELERKIKAQVQAETSEEILSFQKQLDEKTKEVKQMNRLKTELAESKRKFDGLKEEIELEAEVKLNLILIEEKSKIRNQVDLENELKFSEKDNLIEKLKEQTKDMQRKLEQGSMQVQGETQELAIEEYLRACFPLDTIAEIKKGARGADSLQIVNTRTKHNCGSIMYESKRTKEFSGAWIEKFKGDMREKGALMGVLITETMPSDMDRLGLKDGIWVCTYEEFKGLCFALRESVILYSTAMASQENKGDKMTLLYDYLTSNEFRLHVEAIVDGFSQMEYDLVSERRSMEGIWKKREKQIQKVLHSTVHMYSSIKGIGGNSIGTIQALELPAPDKAA